MARRTKADAKTTRNNFWMLRNNCFNRVAFHTLP